MSSDPSQSSESQATPLTIAARNFLSGLLLSGFPVLAYLWLSVDMTDGGWAAVAPSQWIVAIAVPLTCGFLSIRWGQTVIRWLSNLVEEVQLPF